MARGRLGGFKTLVVILLLVYLIQFVLDISGVNNFRIPVIINALIYVGCYFTYLLLYRKDNLLCFELMAIPVAFLGLFLMT